MRSARIPFAVALTTLVLASASFAQQAPKPEPRPLLVGVVDMGALFQSYKRKGDLERTINAKKDELEQKYKEFANTLQNGRTALNNLAPGTDAWREKRDEFRLEAKKMELFREQMDEELKLAVERLTLKLLDEIEAVVRDYAQERGFDLILKRDTKGWGDERFQERNFRAQVASVLYCDSKLDVTTDVLAVLNDPEHLKKVR